MDKKSAITLGVTTLLLIVAVTCVVLAYYQPEKVSCMLWCIQSWALALCIQNYDESSDSHQANNKQRRFLGPALVLALRNIPRNDPRCAILCASYVNRVRRAHLQSPFFRFNVRRRFVPHYLACTSLCAGNTIILYYIEITRFSPGITGSPPPPQPPPPQPPGAGGGNS